MKRPEKITFGQMRAMAVTGVMVDCLDCRRWTTVNADRWADHVRLSDIEPRLVCQRCGARGADVRPDFDTAPKRA